MHGELRYFEVAPGGFSTLERHEHMHAVLILRGRGHCLVGGEVKPIETRDLVTVPPMTWHQFRATRGEPLGFLCMVNASARQAATALGARILAKLEQDAKIAAFLRNEPLRDRSARCLPIYALFACRCSSSLLVAAAQAADTRTAGAGTAFLDIYRELVEIDTTDPPATPCVPAEAMAARLRAGGFPRRISRCSPPGRARATWWRGCAAPARGGRCCCSRISTWSRPSARTGTSIRSS